MNIGGDSRLILEDLGTVAGLYDVTIQSGYPRNVVNERPEWYDILTLIEYARGDSLVERRRLNLVVNREPWFFVSWTGEPLDVPARGLLSRVNVCRMFHSSVRLLCP